MTNQETEAASGLALVVSSLVVTTPTYYLYRALGLDFTFAELWVVVIIATVVIKTVWALVAR